jgi:hypothetical protein
MDIESKPNGQPIRKPRCSPSVRVKKAESVTFPSLSSTACRIRHRSSIQRQRPRLSYSKSGSHYGHSCSHYRIRHILSPRYVSVQIVGSSTLFPVHSIPDCVCVQACFSPTGLQIHLPSGRHLSPMLIYGSQLDITMCLPKGHQGLAMSLPLLLRSVQSRFSGVCATARREI